VIPRSACAFGSRRTKQLDSETVATRVIEATGSFYSARGIGSQASVGAAVDEERWAGKTLLASLEFGAHKASGKRRRIEISLVLVIVMLHVLTYIVSNKLFWN